MGYYYMPIFQYANKFITYDAGVELLTQDVWVAANPNLTDRF